MAQENKYCVQNFWNDEADLEVFQVDNGVKIKFGKDADGVIYFLTKPGKEYIIRSSDYAKKDRTVFAGTPNREVKKLGNRILGKLNGWNDFN